MNARALIFALCVILCRTFYGQTPATPVSPAHQTSTADPGAFWRDATVALGEVVQIGSQSKFIVSGTAVVVALDEHRGCLLTARHMLVDPTTGQLTRALWMRRTTVHGEAMPPIPLTLFDNLGRTIWVTLPNNDLAVIPLPFAQLGNTPISAVEVKEFVSNADDVFQGAQVMVLGYPQVFRNPDQTNPYSTSPIARAGVIAWIDPADPLGKPFLVDANLYGGNSGGPVFRVKSGFDKFGNFVVGGTRFELIGIVSQGTNTTAPVSTGNGKVTVPNPVTGIQENEFAIVPYVGGIGIIEPASKALDLLKMVFPTPPSAAMPTAPQAPR